jgi:hypothetical protein
MHGDIVELKNFYSTIHIAYIPSMDKDEAAITMQQIDAFDEELWEEHRKVFVSTPHLRSGGPFDVSLSINNGVSEVHATAGDTSGPFDIFLSNNGIFEVPATPGDTHLSSGPFNVSLLSIDNSVFEVLATPGDPHLGSEDFDIIDYFLKAYNLEKEWYQHL